MDTVFRGAAAAVIGAVLCLMVRRQSGEFGVLLSVGIVLLLGGMAVQMLEPVMTFADSLRQTAEMDTGIVEPVVKTLAIGLVTELGKTVCEDAGEKSVGGVLQLLGTAAAFYVMLPLMQGVLDLMGRLL